MPSTRTPWINFNPRSPYGERPVRLGIRPTRYLFQSTLPLRGATIVARRLLAGRLISIHAPLTGSDFFQITIFRASIAISIHAPLTGSDHHSPCDLPPAPNFNPRSPYGERPRCSAPMVSAMNFNPRSPYGERRLVPSIPGPHIQISIHAPLTGSDRYSSSAARATSYFNPRSPYGERLPNGDLLHGTSVFQSTLPLRGATATPAPETADSGISIHAPLTGSDQRSGRLQWHHVYFNPRSPYGERLVLA